MCFSSLRNHENANVALGFGYKLDALSAEGEKNELNIAFREIFKQPPKVTFLRVLMGLFPVLDIFVSMIAVSRVRPELILSRCHVAR